MTAFPDGISTVKLTISAGFMANGETPKVEALVRPLHRVTHVATGLPLIPFAVKPLDGADGLEIELPNDSQTGFVDGAGLPVTQWGYQVDVSRTSGVGTPRDTVIRTVTFTAGQTVVDFDLIPAGVDVVDPVTGDFAVVTSVNGLVGDVIVTGGGGAPVTVAWDDVQDKPLTFEPSAHGHQIEDVDGLQVALDNAGVTSYNDLTDKPIIPTAPGDIGAQPSGNYVEGTDTRLSDARVPLLHGHDIADVSGLIDALGAAAEPTEWSEIPGKPVSFPPATHNQPIDTITGLQTELDGKQPAGSYATQGDLTTGLAGKSGTGHTHAISDTAGLQEALDSASGGGGSTAWENVTGKPTVFPPETHMHTTGDVTGLDDALAGKQVAGDYATNTDLSDGLAGKQPTGSYATTSDLTTGLAGKQATGDYIVEGDARLSDARAPLAHDHAVGDVTGLQAALDGKQASGSYATTTDLTTGLAGKQATGDYATNTALATGLGGKANTSHSHGIADLPSGTTITVLYTGTAWPARPTSRTDVTVIWVGGTEATPPPGESTADLWFKDIT